MSEKCGNDSYSSVYIMEQILEYFGDHQIQAWIGNDIDPLQWRWTQSGHRLVPLKQICQLHQRDF
ncbi:hypothetical protein DPMN_115946 [Dreissena polymorpha]|uniref:Uncharacterized protein n=1 Tax=Dreissena polymorpha TaxID=45954 RepID=A0A9D4KMN2_DREPO|nr:hypothetical protein DPMN_115946 [Dreissena polymorpha]